MSKKKKEAIAEGTVVVHENKRETKVLAQVEGMSAEVLIARAIDNQVPVETMEKLLTMRRELKAEYAKEEYDKAMSKFQSEVPTIEKSKEVLNKDGRSVRYKYAPLEVIVAQVKTVLKDNGFSYSIDTLVETSWVTVIVKVTHQMGHSQNSTFKVPIDPESYMNAAQKFASALTFGKRYAFCNAFGILTGEEDNDAQSVETTQVQTSPKTPGGMNQGQWDTIKELCETLGSTVEEFDKAQLAISHVPLSDKTLEQGAKLIDVLRKRVSLKQQESQGTDAMLAEIEGLETKNGSFSEARPATPKPAQPTTSTATAVVGQKQANTAPQPPQAPVAPKTAPKATVSGSQYQCQSCAEVIDGSTLPFIPKSSEGLLCKNCFKAKIRTGQAPNTKTIVNYDEPPFPSNQ